MGHKDKDYHKIKSINLANDHVFLELNHKIKSINLANDHVFLELSHKIISSYHERVKIG